MEKSIVDGYEDFTLSLAIVDAIPVMLFSLSCICMGIKIDNSVFSIGAFLTITGGLCKVMWKFLLATKKRDYHFLNRPLFIVFMPIGMIIVCIEVYIYFRLYGFDKLYMFPTCIFLTSGILGLVAMTLFFKFHNKSDVRNNWIEQFTNIFAQFMFLIVAVIILLDNR